MLKRFIILCSVFVVLGLSGCKHTETARAQVEHHVGEISEQELNTRYALFEQSYQAFEVPEEQLAMIRSLPDGLTMDVYFGTWCHDSQREVPRMLKLLSNKELKVNLVALDFSKQDPQGLAIKNNVKYTPTFILRKNGVEVGRIIERPQSDSLALDLKNMAQ